MKKDNHSHVNKSGVLQYIPSLKSLERIIKDENDEGFCLACGKFSSEIEPDARAYECESCGEKKVYGAEELVLMGIYR